MNKTIENTLGIILITFIALLIATVMYLNILLYQNIKENAEKEALDKQAKQMIFGKE